MRILARNEQAHDTFVKNFSLLTYPGGGAHGLQFLNRCTRVCRVQNQWLLGRLPVR